MYNHVEVDGFQVTVGNGRLLASISSKELIRHKPEVGKCMES